MRTIKRVSLSQCEALINDYVALGGSCYNPVEGCLGLGVIILCNDGNAKLKNIVIEEYYLNMASSGHRIKVYYDELPKKYLEMIDKIL